MKRQGIALVTVLLLALVGSLVGLVAAYTARSALLQEGRQRQASEAQALARLGVDWALLYLQNTLPEGEVSLSGTEEGVGEWEAAVAPEEVEGASGYRVRATARAKGGSAEAQALVRVTEEVRTAFREGWFTGGRVSVSGQLNLYAARLHGDGGYTLNARGIEICLPQGEEVVCRSLSKVPEGVRKALITGGVDARTCNPSNNPLLCQGGKPVSLVCPVWGNPPANDTRPCWDSLAGRMATVSTATRIPPPSLAGLWQEHLGLSLADDPYAALRPNPCPHTATSESQLRSLAASLAGTGAKICVPYGISLSAPLALSGVEVYVNGTVNFNSGASLSLTGASLVAAGGVNLSGPVSASGGKLLASGAINFNSGATGGFEGSVVYGKGGISFNEPTVFKDTKVFSGASVNFNGGDRKRPVFEGNTFLAVNGSLTFNGSLKSSGGASPLIVASGDVTFNGSYADDQSASFIWARGTVRFNGNTTYRGGIASGGGVDVSPGADGIVVNGGLTLYKTNLFNENLPTFTVRSAQAVWRY